MKIFVSFPVKYSSLFHTFSHSLTFVALHTFSGTLHNSHCLLDKRRQLDLVKFQVTYKIGFFVLAAALELAFFLYHSKEALITDISLFFPLNYIVSLPLGCSNCISFWTVYVCVFFIVLTGLQRITRRLPKKYSKKKNDQLNFNTEVPVDVDELESADELVELLPTVPSSTPENKLD